MVINHSECPKGGAHELVEVTNDKRKIIVQCSKCGVQQTAYK